MHFNRCERCGAYLDPGEHCDCEEQKLEKERKIQKFLKMEKSGQFTLSLTKEGVNE